MIINNFSIKKMLNILENDYGCTNINEKTVWLWRMKLIHSIATLPMPKLNGVIQVDETFIRESQKGSRELVSYINGEERTARYGKVSSKYGIMGTEFVTVTTAIDKGRLNYIEFKNLKTNNKLSLARVNELHKDLKKFIYTEKTNVSTKYLEDYIGFFTYLKNWKVRFNRYPNSKKDIEQIFEEILTAKVNYTINDIKTKELDLPKPSGKYMNILIEETKKVREITKNKYFKFNEEDGIVTFNKREYLLDIPRYKLYNLCKEYNIKRFRKLAIWNIVTLLLKQTDIDIKIYQLLEKDRYLRNNDE